MSVTINSVVCSVGDTGTFHDVTGAAWAAKIVGAIDTDQSEMKVKGNTGIQEIIPDKHIIIKITDQGFLHDQLKTVTQVIANGAYTSQRDCFEHS